MSASVNPDGSLGSAIGTPEDDPVPGDIIAATREFALVVNQSGYLIHERFASFPSNRSRASTTSAT